MEQDYNLAGIKQDQHLAGIDNEGRPKINALALAYIGDAVYELKVREHVLQAGGLKVGQLHERAVGYVRAERQSALVAEIEAMLSEKEREVFRRGRNARGGQKPAHASITTYRRATGLEALIGYLYLGNEQERLNQIFAILFREDTDHN